MNNDDFLTSPEFHAFFDVIKPEDPLEFWILKTHAFIEFRLKRLLSLRLDVPSEREKRFLKDIDRMNLFKLTALNFTASQDKKLRDGLLGLNKVRNQVAHQFERITGSEHFRIFSTIVISGEWPDVEAEQHERVRGALALLAAAVGFRIHALEEIKRGPEGMGEPGTDATPSA